MFDILRKEGCAYVTQSDLKSMMAGILLSHPGLEFLQETPEFQDRCSTRPGCGRPIPFLGFSICVLALDIGKARYSHP